MPQLCLSWFKQVWTIVEKDLLCEFRTKYAFCTLGMFALMTLSCISMSLAGTALTPLFAALLLWVVIFFSSMAGLSRSFVQEQECGTFFTLHLYAAPQATLFAKLLLNMFLLTLLIVVLTPLFVLFLQVEVPLPAVLMLVLLLGGGGLAVVATLTAALLMLTRSRGALFTVLTFPVLLPQFLSAISTTAKILGGTWPEWPEILFLAGYDLTVYAVASILFDYLWYD